MVVALRWDHVSNATSWIAHIACVSRNQMHVKMKHGLACNGTDIDAQVETLWGRCGMSVEDGCAGVERRLHQLGAFLRCGEVSAVSLAKHHRRMREESNHRRRIMMGVSALHQGFDDLLVAKMYAVE